MIPSTSSTVPRPPSSVALWRSCHRILSGGSSGRVGRSSGRRPASRLRSAVRAARLAERTEAKVAAASTSVPAAVASEAIVGQSAIPPG